MAKKKGLSGMSFEQVMNQYHANREIEMISVDPEVFNDLWGGGIATGFMYSLWADAGVGKSTLALQAARSFCKKGLKVLFVDVEKALNPWQKETFKLTKYEEDGLFYHVEATNYKEAEDICMSLTGDVINLVVIDSISGLTPAIPKELSVDEVRPGLRAQQESFFLNKIKNYFYSEKISSIVLFHARANINMTGGTQPDVKQAGGFAALHYPDVITKLTSHAQIKGENDGEIIGKEVGIVCTKNKFAPPFRLRKKKLIFGVGISKRIDLIDSALENGIITQSGAYFILPSGDKIRGRKALYDVDASVLKDIQFQLDSNR